MGNQSLSYETEKLEWDEHKVSLTYCLPGKNRNGSCAVIAHGAGGPMYSPFITYFHSRLAEHGFLTVKFNFPYMEARRRYPDRPEILEDCYSRIVERIRTGPHSPRHFFLGGKSMGGRIASQAVSKGLEADGLFFLGYPLHPPGKTQQLRDRHLYQIRIPMLFVSGTRDQLAGKELLRSVVAKIGDNASIHWVEGGDHSLDPGKGKAVRDETYSSLVELLSDWFNKASSRNPT